MATTVNITRSLVVYLYGLLVGVTVFHPIDARLLAHRNRRLICELLVYTGIRRPSVVRPSTFSNDFSSEAVRTILFILHT